MAKDQITLLTNIAAEMKRQNQFSIRQNLENKEYQAAQLALQSGDALEKGGGPELIDDATDFRRRVKASIFSTKMAERITDSGKRAKDTVKENKEKEKQRKLDKKNGKLQRILKADKYVGQSTIVAAIKENNFSNSELTLSLIKVNSDALVHMLGGIRHVLGMNNKSTEKARKAAIKKAKIDARDKANTKRDAEETKRETKDKVKDQAVIKVNTKANANGAGSAGGGGFSKILLLAKALPYLLATAAITLATGAIKDFISGWKEDGLAGAIGQMLGGSGEGIWNAIKQSFKLGGLGATIGGAIGFMFGGIGAIPGAIIGGLIGMAIGAVAGYFGGDRITAGLKDAGTAIADAWEKTKTVVVDIVKGIGLWFYTPGSNMGGEFGTTKTKLFGGLISWDLGIGDRIGEAWRDGKKWVGDLIHKWALKVYNPETHELFGGLFTMPAWFDTIKNTVSGVWDGIKNFGTTIKKAVIGLLPDWFTDRMGWTVDGKPIEMVAEENGITVEEQEAVEAKKERLTNLNKYGMSSGIDLDWNTEEKRSYKLFMRDINKRFEAEQEAKKLKQEAEAKALMIKETSLNLLDNKIDDNNILTRQDGDGGKRWTPTYNTDASSNVGAVVVNNIYSLDQPIGPALISIHDHMDLNYGMSYNGYN